MKNRNVVAVAALFATLSGCATTQGVGANVVADNEALNQWRPQIDTQGVDMAAYEADLSACRTYALENPDADAEQAQRDGAIQGGLLTAAGTGALVVATGGLSVLPAALGFIATNAGVGALAGGYAGGVVGQGKYQSTVVACLSGRGYSVLSY